MANVNNYVAAGRAAVQKNLSIGQALSENKADYGALGQESIKAERDKKIAAIKANAQVANAATDAATKVEGAKIIVDRDKSIAASQRSSRKAGMLAAGAQAIGAAAYLNKKTDAPNEQLGLLGQQISAYDKRIAGLKTKQTEIESGLTDLSKPTASSTDTATDSTKATGTGQQASTPGTDGMGDAWKRWSKLIRAGEGTSGENGYNTMFTGAQFSDTSKHPRQLNRSGDLESDAAGAYQFLSTTWDGAKNALGLTDFSPASQEKAGKYLAQKRGLDTNTIFTDKQSFLKELDKIAPEWASMPTLATGTSYYGQGGLTPDQAWNIWSGN
jgi:muramidase (phage lysozyme)